MPLNPVPYPKIPGFPIRGEYVSPMSLMPLPDYVYNRGFANPPLWWRDGRLTTDPFSLLPWVGPELIQPPTTPAGETIIPVSAMSASGAPAITVTGTASSVPPRADRVEPMIVVDFPPGSTIRRR